MTSPDVPGGFSAPTPPSVVTPPPSTSPDPQAFPPGLTPVDTSTGPDNSDPDWLAFKAERDAKRAEEEAVKKAEEDKAAADRDKIGFEHFTSEVHDFLSALGRHLNVPLPAKLEESDDAPAEPVS